MVDNTTFGNLTNNTNGAGPGPSGGFPPTPHLTAADIVDIFFLCILAVMIVFANSLMIGAFYVNRRLRTRTYFLLMSLAVADMLVGTISLPLWVYFSITFSSIGPAVYRSYVIFDVIFGVSSILNLTAISLERCYSLLRPIKHRNLRKWVFVAIILAAWILATLAGTTIELWDVFHGTVVVTVVFFFVPLAIILVAYCTIFHVARAHVRGREGGSFKKDLRIAITVAVVTGLFVICLTPFFVLSFTVSVCSITKWASAGCQGLIKLPQVFWRINKWLQYGNSLCNPIVYGLRNEEFRRTFRKILLGLCCKKVRITEYEKNLHGGVRKVRSKSRPKREPCCENVQLRSVVIIPSPQPPARSFNMRESHSEAAQSSDPIKPELLTTKSLQLADSLKLNEDHVFHTSPSDLTSASSLLTSIIPVPATSTQLCNPAFEHDQAETGFYPGNEAIPRQEITENMNVAPRFLRAGSITKPTFIL
ncbi:histamine H2 receptor-like [Oculina patagonica]